MMIVRLLEKAESPSVPLVRAGLGVLGLLVVILTGCAFLKAAEKTAGGVPITNIDQIAGKWAGTRTRG